MPLQTELKNRRRSGWGGAGPAARGDHSSLLLPMFSAAAASDFNTFRLVRPPLSLYGGRGGDRQRKMCLRTKNWRRTLSDEAEGRKEGGKVGKASPLSLSRLRFAFCGAAITSLAFRPSVRVVRSRRHENLDAAGVTNGRQCGGAVVDPRIIGKVKPNLLSCQRSRSSHLRLGQLVNSNL